MTDHVFLAAHPDDVPLSCGGTLYHLVEQEIWVYTLNIFAGIPDSDLPFSEFAQYQHRMWGILSQAYQERRAEERKALAQFKVEPVWFDFLDCIYRGEPENQRWYYRSDEDIFGAIHPDDMALVSQLRQTILDYLTGLSESVILYAPLTVGNHVDHQLIFQVALDFVDRGYSVRFYEDYPYSQRNPADIIRAIAGRSWTCELVLLSDAALASKIRAITHYATQLEILFGGEAAMRQKVAAYAYHVGSGHPAERFWTLKQKSDSI